MGPGAVEPVVGGTVGTVGTVGSGNTGVVGLREVVVGGVRVGELGSVSDGGGATTVSWRELLS